MCIRDRSQIVHDEDAQVEGIIRDQFGSRRLEDIKLGLCPFEIAVVVREFCISKSRILADQLFGKSFINLGIQQGCFPHLTGHQIIIAEVKFCISLHSTINPRKVDHLFQIVNRFGQVIDV